MHGYRLITTALLWLGSVCVAHPAMAAAPASTAAAANDPLVDQWARQVGQTMQARLRSMASSGEPRQLYLAGLLWVDADADAASAADGGYAPIQRVWLQRALDARPRDPLVARMEAAGCAPALRCDPGAALAFLEQADVRNASVHLRAYTDAQRRGDQAAAERAWQAAVQSDHFDSGALALGKALHASYDGVQWPSLASVSLRAQLDAQGMPSTGAGMAAMFVMGAWSAYALPALGDLMRRCSPTGVTAALRDECMAVLNNVANDESTLATALIGSRGMAALSSGADATRWQARVRELQWLQQQEQPRASTVDGLADKLDAVLTQGEVPALRARLQRQGLAVQPPAGWQPGAPGQLTR
ncbi:hypothetical protein VB145_19380 [Xanthomonas arboricola]|uniref:Lipoprotein n=1 Tax=Xanthomonas campestris pv. juglandis TaxID=195709 RepID=A0A8E4GC81_XANCJ|nr:hypothetical protein [Xanthomonas arboricola]AKU52481.1 hypothetical protein AKJ12_18800 [Xanthomonas arboricola pv. juglandis]KOA99154.1 hypothetical protein AE921_12875 [Xanthomonas arboricola]KOB02857.1 hypothetical protein AE920_01810 [Xanthomonas arboricola]KOB09914.1 hypothetical protein AE922_05820 [Xanthomonas arboricola]KOB12010.1 hypothetical protein AE923_02685 [Xanthomonas arboricola]